MTTSSRFTGVLLVGLSMATALFPVTAQARCRVPSVPVPRMGSGVGSLDDGGPGNLVNTGPRQDLPDRNLPDVHDGGPGAGRDESASNADDSSCFPDPGKLPKQPRLPHDPRTR